MLSLRCIDTVGSKKADLKDKFCNKFVEIGYISPITPVSFIESYLS